jgi:predicted N-acyltransferase
MLNWLWKLIWPSKPVEGYRLLGAEDRRQEEEIKKTILRKLRNRNDHTGK